MSVDARSIGGGRRVTNKAGCAEFFDVTMTTIDAWIRKGMPVLQRGSNGISWEIDLLAVAQWRFTPKTADGEVDPESMEPLDRMQWYKGTKDRVDLMKIQRQLIPDDEVQRDVATAFAALSSDVQAIPDNLERRHGVAPEVAALVESALFESLDAMAERLAKLSPAVSVEAST